MRNITLDELMGFRDALLALCIKVDLSEFNPWMFVALAVMEKIRLTFQPLTSFVAAGAGIPIAKHGNYGVSSVSGSSNVMEYLGISFETNTEKLKSQLEAANICYLHAPLFHPALKNVGPVYKEMGVRTFNMLGPLVNPAQPKNSNDRSFYPNWLGCINIYYSRNTANIR